MIQRKQSLWLLLAALLNAGVFAFDIFKYHAVVPVGTPDTSLALRVNDHFPSLLIALVMTLLPLVAIFMFKARKRQVSMSIVSMVAVGSFITLSLSRVSSLQKTGGITNGSYGMGAVLPVAALVFLVLAIIGIRKDERLVRSMDRLR